MPEGGKPYYQKSVEASKGQLGAIHLCDHNLFAYVNSVF